VEADVVEKEPSTLFFQAPKVVLFVDVGAAIVDACEKGCDPIRVIRATSPADATKRIVELHPLLVLVGASVSPADEDEIFQHASATGSVLVKQREVDAAAPEEWMRESVRAAVRLRAIRSL
jgi:hypothetical protein